MATHNIKNISTGIRGFNSTDGLVEIAPGQTAEGVELTSGELKSSKRTGWFEIDGDGDDEQADEQPADDLDTTVTKLREIAKAETIDLGKLTAKGDIQDAIRLARVAKATTGKGSGNDALDAMDDDTLRSTVQALTAKSADDVAGLDRDALLALARGEG